MTSRNPSRYSPVAQALHWLVALLVASQIWLAITAFRAPDPAEAAALLARHRPLGLMIMLLMLARLGWRLANPPPPLPVTLNRPGRALARLTHRGFYVLLIAIPMVGWVKAGADGVAVQLAGTLTLPSLASPDPDVARTLRATHLYLNTMLLALLPLHVLAALWHQLWRRDGTLLRMLPGRARMPADAAGP